MKRILLYCAAIVCVCHADDIYKKDGYVLFNAQILDTVIVDGQKYLNVNYNDNSIKIKLLQIQLQNIVKIVPSPFDMTIVSNYLKIGTNISYFTKKEYRNIHFISVSLIGAAFTIDQFLRASDMSDGIDQVRAILPSADVSKLESQKTRATVFGILGAIGTAASLYYALDAVTVSINGQSLSLAVNF